MSTGTGPDVDAAYRACEAVTREQARNFHYGIRLLPPPKRAALSAVYALARRIDDVGDGDAAPEAKTAALERLRASFAALAGPDSLPGDDPVLIAVADVVRRFPIPVGAFEELVDGVSADAVMDAEAARAGVAAAPYRTFDDLVRYCRCVAGSVGRLCLGVFGARPHPDAAHHADALGIALQQTNILRDIREDLQGGRIYLPTEELEAHGVELALGPHGGLRDPDGGLAELIRASADRARGWYDDGLRLIPLLDRRSAACATAMAGIYRRLLDDIATDPTSVYHRRHALTGWQKAGVAARALLSGTGAAGDSAPSRARAS